ncbi:hypothetical protein [Atlantibacter hermannii]|uniref:hypothetical protein n=1 Tax=Atlantibacter hermannii TaxID=565 RepID=UPI0028B1F342|nr:hypothetical protein [Atlantibacter hermannii]
MAPPSTSRIRARNDAELRRTLQRMEKWRIQTGDSYEKKMFKVAGMLSEYVQKEVNRAIDSPVPFTAKSGIFYKATRTGRFTRLYQIGVKDIQNIYLSALIDKQKPTTSLVPVAKKFTDKYGNIKGLRKNLANGSYVRVNHSDSSILINKAAKKREDRLIAIKRTSVRKKPIKWPELEQKIIKMFNDRIDR